ncbi:MAG: SDR family oxidoreductase [Chloroflexota bacterium]
MDSSITIDTLTGSEIAIVGMACRFPGASDIQSFWHNLCQGVDSLTDFTEEELIAAGVDPKLLQLPNYVKTASILGGDEELFDAAFFGYTPREAEFIDPQQRLFMECTWQALEDAGYDPARFPGTIGVFGGAKTNTYVLNIIANRDRLGAVDNFQIAVGNDLTCLTTRISYKFNLQGPSYAIHTACSTSLVAIHLARQSLLTNECEMALAGGVAVNVPYKTGFLYQEGGVAPPDGRCRAFDAEARGSIFGNGVGVVALKRLEDALADGDNVYAVIKGAATNNDGAAKASYTAPGVDGQMNVILDALADAEVEPSTISYIEAHGTGTLLGDPIEMRAITKAFQTATDATGFCRIGSLKTNVGHLETAAGVASIIKTALALKHRQIPPSLFFTQANPSIDFTDSPFYVNTTLSDWDTTLIPRRAGVSSFGIGSTNAHAILEEAPQRAPSSSSRPWQVLLLSAKTSAALDKMSTNLADWLEANPQIPIADAAYTLQIGRQPYNYRQVLVCQDRQDAITTLRSNDKQRNFKSVHEQAESPVIFMFSGLSDQYINMAASLYAYEPTFQNAVDFCATFLMPLLDCDLRSLIYPEGVETALAATKNSRIDLRQMLRRDGTSASHDQPLHETVFAQPALFVVEYALAQLFMEWGIQPQAMIGYSIGEYVAACLAGVFSLEDALTLVAQRARLIQEQPIGAMLAVNLPEKEIHTFLGSHLSLAATNGPQSCVVAGSVEAIQELKQLLTNKAIVHQQLQTTHAFHSHMLRYGAPALVDLCQQMTFNKPSIPYVSNVTGTWITDEQATDPHYWATHMCETVRFAEGIHTVQQNGHGVLLEIGPGQALCSFARQLLELNDNADRVILPSLPPAYHQQPDLAFMLTTIGRLWLSGVSVDWESFWANERRYRVSLPTYPFERKRYWIDPPSDPQLLSAPQKDEGKKADIADWFYVPTWKEHPLPTTSANPKEVSWLIFLDETGLGHRLAAQLRQKRHIVTTVAAGAQFACDNADTYVIDPTQQSHYVTLFRQLDEQNRYPDSILHMWSIGTADQTVTTKASFTQAQNHGLYSLMSLAQSLGIQGRDTMVDIAVISSHVQSVNSKEPVHPERATVLGPCLIIPQEYPNIICRNIDIEHPDSTQEQPLIDQIIAECVTQPPEYMVAFRGSTRLVQTYVPERVEHPDSSAIRLRERGVYLISGGLGDIGYHIARHLAQTVQARLILTRRSELLPRDQWDDWLITHDKKNPHSRVIAQIRELESLGADVLVLSADVANPDHMQTVVAQAFDHFGTINGVIHAAGVLDSDTFKVIQQASRRECEQHFQSKVYGLLVLQQALQEIELDFCLLMSSISSILGGLGYIGYATANIFMDAFARSLHHNGQTQWMSVQWDSWHRKDETDQSSALGATLVELAMTPQEGVAVFDRIMSLGIFSTMTLSVSELQMRIDQWVNLKAMRSATSPGQEGVIAFNANPQDTLIPSSDDLTASIQSIWQRVLGLEQVGIHDNFFDVGGNSLTGMQLLAELKRELNVQVAPVALFESPTISALTRLLSPKQTSTTADQLKQKRHKRAHSTTTQQDIAIVGIAGRFPGSVGIEQFWDNLCNGIESTTFFSTEELLKAGIEPEIVNDPRYVKARPMLQDVDLFDAAFFGYAPREAELMDPQQRLFLEVAWEAFESAGYTSQSYEGLVGVFGGAGISSYLFNLYSNPDLVTSVGTFQTIIGNDKDTLTTRVSYKLNLKGPSMAVQTYCSTSLVAVHMACQSLLNGECDMAMAGGVSVIVPEKSGYFQEEGGFISPDGHVRAFDAKAQGLVYGNGVAVVVLKSLDDAIEDGDYIHAVIKGTAVNNDGSHKVGFTATSVEGQTEVIAAALDIAQVPVDSIRYVETHGSGTVLGDPIEVAALTKAFRRHSEEQGFCALGSVKTNVGHLDRASGVTGLIKAALALKHGVIPPSLHFEEPNPAIDFDHSPFFVNTILRPWEANGAPRRAGVNSLGLGGTNAHAILEEPPSIPTSVSTRSHQLLLLSAKTSAALQTAANNLAAHLRRNPEQPLADVAYTLQVGREVFSHRLALTCVSADDASTALETNDPKQVTSFMYDGEDRPVIVMFPGLGGQYLGMAYGLYQNEPAFQQTVDQCADILQPLLGFDLRTILYPDNLSQEMAVPEENKIDLRAMLQRGTQLTDEQTDYLNQTHVAHPTLFVIEYALAQLLLSWGVQPQAYIGYSIGEYVAACLAEVFTLEDALMLVAQRAQMIDNLPVGAMLAVPLMVDEIAPLLHDGVEIAAINGPNQSVLGGTPEAIASLERHLLSQHIACRRLQASHAFHTTLMQPTAEPFEELLQSITLRPPTIPYISNVTGTWVTTEQSTSPTFWAQHMCQPVRFADSIRELTADPHRVFLEAGPGQTLGSMIMQQDDSSQEETIVLTTLRHAYERQDDAEVLLSTLGKLWLTGVPINWKNFYTNERRQRIPLPTHPFERQRYWIDAQPHAYDQRGSQTIIGTRRNNAHQIYIPSWKRAPVIPHQPRPDQDSWLVFADQMGISDMLTEHLHQSNQMVTIINAGTDFAADSQGAYTINPREYDNYRAVLEALYLEGSLPKNIIYCWGIASDNSEYDSNLSDESVHLMCLGLQLFVRAIDQYQITETVHLWVVSNQLHEVTGTETLAPSQGALLGLCRVLPHEYPQIVCYNRDIMYTSTHWKRSVEQLAAELCAPTLNQIVAYRGNHCWVPVIEAAHSTTSTLPSRLRTAGAYLLFNGLNETGILFARYLAQTVAAQLIFVEPAPLVSNENGSQEGSGVSYTQMLEESGIEFSVIVQEELDQQQIQELLVQISENFNTNIQGVIYLIMPDQETQQSIHKSDLLQCLAQAHKHKQVMAHLAAALQQYQLDIALTVLPLHMLTGRVHGLSEAVIGNITDLVLTDVSANSISPWLRVYWESNIELKSTTMQALFALDQGSTIIVSADYLPDNWNSVALPSTIETIPDDTNTGYARPSLRSVYQAPRTDIERQIVEIWEELLGVSQIGIHDNFLDLGGDSLLATRFVTRLNTTIETKLPMRTVFEAPTIAELGQSIEQMTSEVEKQDVSELLDLLEGLSEEEVEQELLRRMNAQ